MFEDVKLIVFDDWRAAFVGILVAIIFNRAIAGFNYVRLALTRSIWKPFLQNKKQITVVLTTKSSNSPTGTPKVSLSEVEAFSALQETLHSLNLTPELSHRPNCHLKDMPGHVVSIGGPKANSVTQEILASIAEKYPTMPTYDAQDECILAGSKRYKTEYTSEKTLAKDYGIVIRATGLQNDKNSCYFVAFALRGRATWGAVKTITIDKILKSSINKNIGKEDFVLVLEFAFANNEISATKIVSLQPYKDI